MAELDRPLARGTAARGILLGLRRFRARLWRQRARTRLSRALALAGAVLLVLGLLHRLAYPIPALTALVPAILPLLVAAILAGTRDRPALEAAAWRLDRDLDSAQVLPTALDVLRGQASGPASLQARLLARAAELLAAAPAPPPVAASRTAWLLGVALGSAGLLLLSLPGQRAAPVAMEAAPVSPPAAVAERLPAPTVTATPAVSPALTAADVSRGPPTPGDSPASAPIPGLAVAAPGSAGERGPPAAAADPADREVTADRGEGLPATGNLRPGDGPGPGRGAGSGMVRGEDPNPARDTLPGLVHQDLPLLGPVTGSGRDPGTAAAPEGPRGTASHPAERAGTRAGGTPAAGGGAPLPWTPARRAYVANYLTRLEASP